jgi:glucose/arabinose dehydrogenase
LALVVWGGGSVGELAAVAATSGCPSLRSVWTSVPDVPRLVGYVIGAPAVVNATFLEALPGDLPPDTPLILVCAATSRPPPGVRLEPALGGIRFMQPIEVGAYPGGRLFVAEQPGFVRLVAIEGGTPSTLLDIQDQVRNDGNEEGLLSFALDPAFAVNGYAYTYYSASSPRRSVLARYLVSGDRIEPASELVILEVRQPFSNHNGGAIRFGPDGMLYLGLGDGGGAGDPEAAGQDPGKLLGTVIRLDVSDARPARPYAVPADNPGISISGARPEVWAYGFRNPWRMAFDARTGTLWLGDVGQGRIEEVDVVRAGENYGWSVLEGNDCFEPSSGCVRSGTTPPVATYDHGDGRCSITGGVVYRGPVDSLLGLYLYGDFCSGRIWALPAGASGPAGAPFVLLDSDVSISTFGTDEAGHAYVADLGGPIYRLVAD